MADNVAITEGAGKSIASDEIAGVNYQQVKLADGTLDSTTGIYSGTGVSTNAMRVTMANDSSTLGVYLASTAGTINVALKPGTIAVQLDPGHLLGSVTANAGSGTMTVVFDPGHELGSIKGTNSSLAVFLDPGHLLGSVTANAGTGTMTVAFDPGHTLGSLSSVGSITNTVNVQFDPGHTLGNIGTVNSITNTVAVFFSPANPSVNAAFSGSIGVFFSPSNPSVNATFTATSLEVVPTTGSRKITDDASASQRVLIVGSQTNASLTINGTVTANAGSGTMAVYFDQSNPSINVNTFAGAGVKVSQGDGASATGMLNILPMALNLAGTHDRLRVDSGLANRALRVVHATDIATSINIVSIGTASTLSVYLPDTGHTLGKVDQGSGGTSAWLTNIQGTASIFTASGTASGVSVSGNTIISPSANASFKVYAYSIQTTGAVSIATKFTNGAGTSPTEFWRPLITASAVTGAQGANLATQPGAPIFVTGTSTTLSLVLDSATLVHYSVAYTKESA